MARTGITWSWTDALRGALCAAPAVPLLLTGNISLGMCLALGTLPVAMLGVPPARRRRPRLVLVGAAFAAAYAAGCAIGDLPVLAVAALAALAYGGTALAERRPAARVVPALLAPGFALGMNEPLPDGLALAAMFLAGGAWATVVACLWPDARPAARPHPPPQRDALYPVLFAAAAGIGLALGYLLDLAHVAWAAAAAMFIMRPDPGLLASRALGRTAATFAGVLVASLVFHRGPTQAALAVIMVCTVAAILAVRTSPWYVTAAGTGLLVLLMSGVTSVQAFEVTLRDRLLETAIGAGLALALGVVVRGRAGR